VASDVASPLMLPATLNHRPDMLKPFSEGEASDRDQVLRRFTLTSLGALDSRLDRHNLIHRVTLPLLPAEHPPSPDAM